MAAAAAPDKGMLMGIPVGRRLCNSIDHLLPGLKAASASAISGTLRPSLARRIIFARSTSRASPFRKELHFLIVCVSSSVKAHRCKAIVHLPSLSDSPPSFYHLFSECTT